MYFTRINLQNSCKIANMIHFYELAEIKPLLRCVMAITRNLQKDYIFIFFVFQNPSYLKDKNYRNKWLSVCIVNSGAIILLLAKWNTKFCEGGLRNFNVSIILLYNSPHCFIKIITLRSVTHNSNDFFQSLRFRQAGVIQQRQEMPVINIIIFCHDVFKWRAAKWLRFIMKTLTFYRQFTSQPLGE